jgi:hypothetical protein
MKYLVLFLDRAGKTFPYGQEFEHHSLFCMRLLQFRYALLGILIRMTPPQTVVNGIPPAKLNMHGGRKIPKVQMSNRSLSVKQLTIQRMFCYIH